MALAVTVDWFGFMSGGHPAPFDAKRLSEILTARPSYREKILAALEGEENFLPK